MFVVVFVGVIYFQVLTAEIASISGNNIQFKNGSSQPFDAIVFCTGFKRSTNSWLKVILSKNFRRKGKGVLELFKDC